MMSVRVPPILIEPIKQRFSIEGPDLIAEEFGFSVNSIRTYASALKVPTKAQFQAAQKKTQLEVALKKRYSSEGPEPFVNEFGYSRTLVTETAKRLGLSHFSVQDRSHYRKRNRWEHQRIETIIKDRYEKEGAIPIARDLGLSPSQIMGVARRAEVQTVWQARTAATKRQQNPNCNAKVFEDPLTEEAAYFLGLVWADGSISYEQNKRYCLSISLIQSEWHLLDALASFLGVEGHRYGPKRRLVSHQWQSCFSIGNRDLVDSLFRRGFIPDKSGKCAEHPKNIPENLYFAFARGWLDGDGSISYGLKNPRTIPYLAWYGSDKALETVRVMLCKLAEVRFPSMVRQHNKETNKCWGIHYYSKKDVFNLMNWMHQRKGTYAFRKHNCLLAQIRGGDFENLEEEQKLVAVARVYSWGNYLPEKGFQESILRDSFQYYRETGFPLVKLGRDSSLSIWKKLCEAKTDCLLKNDIVSCSIRGQALCHNYHQHIWETRSKGNWSAKEMFEDDNTLKAVLSNRLWYGRGTYPAQLIQGIRMSAMIPSVFPPLVAKWVCDNYLARNSRVLDPCAGWSSRLLGSLASEKMVHYTGTDPSEKTFQGLKKTVEDLFLTERSTILKVTAEDYETKESSFDLIFTSPPFYDKEEYAPGDQTQVRIKFPTWTSFVNEWMFLVLKKWFKFLKEGGLLILNTSNSKTQKLTDVFLEQALKVGFVLKEMKRIRFGVRPSKARMCVRYEDLLVFTKF